jgi:hypothetical protein
LYRPNFFADGNKYRDIAQHVNDGKERKSDGKNVVEVHVRLAFLFDSKDTINVALGSRSI